MKEQKKKPILTFGSAISSVEIEKDAVIEPEPTKTKKKKKKQKDKDQNQEENDDIILDGSHIST